MIEVFVLCPFIVKSNYKNFNYLVRVVFQFDVDADEQYKQI